MLFIQPDTIVPNPSDPKDLNRYAYTRANPLKYNDPTGHVTQGQYNDAMDIIKQLQDDYGVTIIVDFGWQQVKNPVPGGPLQVWEEGRWDIKDLRIVQSAMGDLAQAAGSKEAVQHAIGGVKIRRVAHNTEQFRDEVRLADSAFRQDPPRGVWGPKIAVVHELAHYWDWKTGWFGAQWFNAPGAIVSGMSSAIRGEAGPTWYARTAGAKEDWAESVVGYVYPRYFNILRAENRPWEDPALLGLGSNHYAYAVARFRALRVGGH